MHEGRTKIFWAGIFLEFCSEGLVRHLHPILGVHFTEVTMIITLHFSTSFLLDTSLFI